MHVVYKISGTVNIHILEVGPVEWSSAYQLFLTYFAQVGPWVALETVPLIKVIRLQMLWLVAHMPIEHEKSFNNI